MGRKRKIPENTKYFTYNNVNPYGKVTGDCTERALSFILNKSWGDVYKEMLDITLKTGWALGSRENIEQYLKSLGYRKQKMPKKENGKKYTGEEFAKLHPRGKYFISIGAAHVTSMVDGKIYDIWNCTHKCVGNYWIIEE